MKILRYPVELYDSDDGVTALFPDMPYGVTCGETKEAALASAIDCLEEIIASLMQDKKDIPPPSPAHKRQTVTLSPSFSAKAGQFIPNSEKWLHQNDNLNKLEKALDWAEKNEPKDNFDQLNQDH